MVAHPKAGIAASVVLVICCGAVLRLWVWYENPPNNAYDDHLEVIAHLARTAERPDLQSCFQCYQPPLYYLAGAVILRATHMAWGSYWISWKAVQLLGVICSFLSMIVLWRVLVLLELPTGLVAFGVSLLAFLPRDIYTSVFISNDAPLTLLVSLSIWAYLRCLRSERHHVQLLTLCGVVTAAAWTKQSGLIVLVLPVSALLWMARDTFVGAGRWIAPSLVIIFALAAVTEEALRSYETGQILASNQHWYDWAVEQPPGSLRSVDFTSFRWLALFSEPQMVRDDSLTLDSFWTELFARLWFDYEPKLVVQSKLTAMVAGCSYAMGLLVSALWVFGLLALSRDARSRREMVPLLLVQLAFVAVPLIQTIRFPYFSSMKAVFMLPAAPVVAIQIVVGLRHAWRLQAVRASILAIGSGLLMISLLQALLVARHIGEALGQGPDPVWPFPLMW